jgi:hypothetical protein
VQITTLINGLKLLADGIYFVNAFRLKWLKSRYRLKSVIRFAETSVVMVILRDSMHWVQLIGFKIGNI